MRRFREANNGFSEPDLSQRRFVTKPKKLFLLEGITKYTPRIMIGESTIARGHLQRHARVAACAGRFPLHFFTHVAVVAARSQASPHARLRAPTASHPACAPLTDGLPRGVFNRIHPPPLSYNHHAVRILQGGVCISTGNGADLRGAELAGST